MIAVLAVLTAGMAPTAAQRVPNPFPPDDMVVKTLANGLRLVVREDHSLPLVAMTVVVRGGSGVDAEARGIAHILEHLALQGTRNYPGPLAPENALEQAGGLCNAATTRDGTRFEAVVPSSQVELVTEVLADVVLAPTLADESLTRERPTILSEIQDASDDPLTAAIDRAYWLTYRAHPYRSSPTGTIQDVLLATPAKARDFYRRWYVPNNMSVVMVGDVTVERAVDLVRKAFGEAKPATLPRGPAPELPGAGGTAVAHFSRALEDTYQVMAFAAPPTGDFPAMVATDVALTLLADGEQALLPGWWNRDGLKVKRYGAEFVSSRCPGRFLIWAQTDAKTALRLRDSTLALLRRCAGEPVPDELLALAKARLTTSFLQENEPYSQQAQTLAFYEAAGGAELACQYLPAVEAVTTEQAMRAVPTALLGWVTVGKRPEGGG